MTNLNLSPEQAETLKEMLIAHLSELSSDIADTDNRDFRDMLKQKRASLNEVLSMLE